MNVATSGDVETKERLNKALRQGNESYMKLMEELFRDAGWLADARGAAKHARKRRRLLLSPSRRCAHPPLHDNRVVLLARRRLRDNPASAPVSPIIGGYVLAGELVAFIRAIS